MLLVRKFYGTVGSGRLRDEHRRAARPGLREAAVRPLRPDDVDQPGDSRQGPEADGRRRRAAALARLAGIDDKVAARRQGAGRRPWPRPSATTAGPRRPTPCSPGSPSPRPATSSSGSPGSATPTSTSPSTSPSAPPPSTGTPGTVFGGAIVKNGYGKHPEEVYVCPRAFDGEYTVRVETIYNDDGQARHRGHPRNHHPRGDAPRSRRRPTVNLGQARAPVVVNLDRRPRKKVLPFIAPPAPPGPSPGGEAQARRPGHAAAPTRGPGPRPGRQPAATGRSLSRSAGRPARPGPTTAGGLALGRD